MDPSAVANLFPWFDNVDEKVPILPSAVEILSPCEEILPSAFPRRVPCEVIEPSADDRRPPCELIEPSAVPNLVP